MLRQIIILVLMSSFSIFSLFGQEEQVQDTLITKESFEKIEVKKGFSPQYRFSKSRKRIYTEKQYEKCLISINDEEATRLFKKSNSLGYNAKFLSYPGAAAILWPLYGLRRDEKFNVKLFGAGCGLFSVALFLAYQADRLMIKSVERYNKVLEDKYGISLKYFPENKKLGFSLSLSF